MKSIPILVGLWVATLVYLFGYAGGQYAGYVMGQNDLRGAYYSVQVLCDKAHNEVSSVSEQACGDAQDKTHTEYLCNYGGTACWVELK